MRGGFGRLLLGLRTRGGFRSMSVCLAALMLGVTAAGCSPPPPLAINLSGAWTTRTVDDRQVSLSLPTNWNVGQAWVMPSSFSDLVGSFSNEALSQPCTTGANSIECGPPLTTLQRGGVLVEVFQNGAPTWTINSQPGAATTVSGLSARVDGQTGSQAACGGLGSDRSRTEVIALPNAPDNYFEIAICSRGLADAVGARIMASVQVTPSV